jgi:hypothetical protein
MTLWNQNHELGWSGLSTCLPETGVVLFGAIHFPLVVNTFRSLNTSRGEDKMDPIAANLAVNFNEMHVIAREIVALRQVVELGPSPEVHEKVAKLQELAATAQSAAMSIQRNCDALSRRMAELENELCRTSDKHNISQQYSTPLEELEICDPLSAEGCLLVFRDTAGSRITVQLLTEAIPDLLQKLNSCR